MSARRAAAGGPGRCRGTGDRGSAGLFVAVLAPFLIGLAGLVFDGGLALEARQRALDAAEQAARAAGNQCNPALLRSRSECVITDQSLVDRVVGDYMRNGVELDGQPRITNQGHTIVVKTRTTVDTIFLGLFGVNSFAVEVDAVQATTVTGLA